ncbi:sister chromatid cohesion protein PDS5-like protein [Senna tora]|uniref:Sister chromatid cohesion protein PDS5-like protein n=1 Tax=Senna tora TaxID=362788 RepID=A0A834T3V7_9FABA|nr:sister chromatid cohesion protein PDS5-like protein [Senna tora]
MASSSIGESRGIPVVGIRNTYCECGIRARIMISESERNPNRLYATCAKYPKCNYYVWLTPRRVGDRESGNQDTNNSVQSSIDNVDSAIFCDVRSVGFAIEGDPQLEAEMMNRLQNVLPPFPFEQLLPFPFVQVSFSVPWELTSIGDGDSTSSVRGLMPFFSRIHEISDAYESDRLVVLEHLVIFSMMKYGRLNFSSEQIQYIMNCSAALAYA